MFDVQLKLSEYTLVYKKVDISEKMYIYIYIFCLLIKKVMTG